MATINQLYGTTNQTITITITSLGSTSLRQSTVVSNTTNLHMDVKIQVTAKTNAAGTSATGAINVYAYATANGSTYSGGATGSDAAFTANKDQLAYLGSIPAVANATTYIGLFNLSRAFGYGGIPAGWGIVVENLSGAALDASVGSAAYQGISATVA